MMKLKTTLLGLTLAFGLNQFAMADNGRRYESNQKIDRIQVNKMKALKRELKEELHYRNLRQVRYIKYDIITLAQKDIRFQKKKIRDLQNIIEDHNHPYYRKGNANNRNRNDRGRNQGYYDNGNNRNSFNLREARQELRMLRSQLEEKKQLLRDLDYAPRGRNRSFNKDLRVVRELIINMQDDVNLHYNNNIDSPYYRRRK